MLMSLGDIVSPWYDHEISTIPFDGGNLEMGEALNNGYNGDSDVIELDQTYTYIGYEGYLGSRLEDLLNDALRRLPKSLFVAGSETSDENQLEVKDLVSPGNNALMRVELTKSFRMVDVQREKRQDHNQVQ